MEIPTVSAASLRYLPKPKLQELERLLTPRLTRYIPHSPTEPQQAFLLLAGLEAFYGGSAGGGKSDALLAAALQYVDVPTYDALILRRTFPELSKPGAIMARSHEWLRGTDAKWNEQRKTWTFPSTATLSFGYCRQESDVYQYQGAEYDFIGFDELTQFTEWQFTYLFSRLRRREGSEIPTRMRAASNPGGIGHGFVKKRYITDRQPGVAFIPARMRDNPYLDQDGYVASLDHLPEVTRQQLLNGDWGVFEGAAYPMFDRSTHVVELSAFPDSWQRFESMDHGVAAPTAWHLFCVDYDGNLIVADSYYVANELPDVHAKEILRRRAEWWEAHGEAEDGWKGRPLRHACFGDPSSLRERLGTRNQFGEPATLQDEYERLGLRIAAANNRRRAGFIRLAELLKPDPDHPFPLWHPRAGAPGSPRLFVTSRSPDLIEQLENAPIAAGENDPDKGLVVDGKWEGDYGHAHAACRYGVMSRVPTSVEPEADEPDDPRQALLKRMKERSGRFRDDLVEV